MRGTGIRVYYGVGFWLAVKYGLWNACVLAVWAFAIAAGAALGWRLAS